MDGASDGMVADGAIDGMVADGASDGMVADGASDGSAVDAGSDAKTEDGGGDAKAADSGSDAEAADGGDAGSEGGTCVLPSCLTDLETNCSPSGTCSQTTDSSSGNTYTCYDNGIILGNILDLNGDNTITARTAGSICYSIEYTGNNINNVATDVPVTSGSDAGVAVLHQDIAADGYTPIWSVTCGSAPAVTLDPSCLNTWPLAWIESDGTFDCTGTATCTW
jgi:hypothetical protein